jgi:RHS repeat-associated protein
MSQVTSYVWDEENRMVGVVNPDSSSESFSYSGDGQRRSKSTLDDLINYVWDGENVLQEVDGSTGEIKAHYTDSPGYWGELTSLHTAGSTPDAEGAQFNAATFGGAMFNQASVSTDAGSHFYLFDQQANTRQLTDTSGDVSDTYAYRAFGEQEFEQGSTRNPHRFQGQVGPYTDATDRVWMRARIYGPDSGQWLSRDPIGFDGGDWNLYRLVGNNPIHWLDPEGLVRLCCIWPFWGPLGRCCGGKKPARPPARPPNPPIPPGCMNEWNSVPDGVKKCVTDCLTSPDVAKCMKGCATGPALDAAASYACCVRSTVGKNACNEPTAKTKTDTCTICCTFKYCKCLIKNKPEAYAGCISDQNACATACLNCGEQE